MVETKNIVKSKNKLESLPFYGSVQTIKNSIGKFESKSLSKNEMKILAITEKDFPVIAIENKSFLVAVNSKSFTGIRWLADWFEIVSIYRDKDNSHHVKLKVRDKIVEVDYGMLYPKDITCLTKYGVAINFDHVSELSKYIFKLISEYNIEDQTYNVGFVERDGVLEFDAYDMEPQILQYTPDITMDAYTAGINELLTNAAIMLALSCSCASLFLAYLSMKCGITLQSFIISFYGKSTTGKSTSQTMMASVYTKPDDNKVYIPFFSTLAASIRNISNKFGVVHLYDEATVSSNINMESLLYTITLEHDKSRCNSNATLKATDTWKTIVITSSENRLLPETRMHNKGLDARLLSFGDLRYTDSRDHSDRIHDFCNRNYGILGKNLAEYLLKAQPDEITNKYNKCKESLRTAIGERMFFDLTERLVNEYALILTAATILSEFNIKIDIEGVTALLTDNHREIAERSNIAEKFYNHIMTYVALNPFSTALKIDQSKNTVAIIDETFLKILTSHGASNTELVIKELDAAGYIYRRKHNSIKNRLRFNNVLTSCYELYMPTEGSDEMEEYTSLEYILTNYEGIDKS